MGSPVSPCVANLKMEDFEQKALTSAPNPPHVWYRYVDDTFTVIHQYFVEEFTNHLNSQDQNIKFTIEQQKEDQLPFLDVNVILQDDGSLKTKVYRKPTHTDQYLNWESNHHLEHKRSVVRSLMRRAEKVVSDSEDKKEEIKHVKDVLRSNGYKNWAFEIPKRKQETNKNEQPTRSNQQKIPVGIPYISGLSEKLQRIFRSHGIPSYHKPQNTLRSLLVRPKDKTPKEKQCGLIYSFTCKECETEYIGETARSLGTRFKEHTDGKHPNSDIQEHITNTGHQVSINDIEIVSKENKDFQRKIREAVTIHKRQPNLNRDRGHEIPPILLQLVSRDPPGHVTTKHQH